MQQQGDTAHWIFLIVAVIVIWRVLSFVLRRTPRTCPKCGTKGGLKFSEQFDEPRSTFTRGERTGVLNRDMSPKMEDRSYEVGVRHTVHICSHCGYEKDSQKAYRKRIW